MSRFSALFCLAICLLSVLSFSSGLPISALSTKLSARRNKLGSFAVVDKTGSADCSAHPTSCANTAGDTIIAVNSVQYNNLVADLSASWNSIVNGFSEIQQKLNVDFANLQKFETPDNKGKIEKGLSGLIQNVLSKVNSPVVDCINSLHPKVQNELSKVSTPISTKLKTVFSNAKQQISNMKSTSGSDMKKIGTSSEAKNQLKLVTRTSKEAKETNAGKELSYVSDDYLSGSNVAKIMANAGNLGSVFSVVDINKLGLGFPIVLFQDCSHLKGTPSSSLIEEKNSALSLSSSSSFSSVLNSYFQFAMFDVFKNIIGEFVVVIVEEIILALISVVIMEIELASLGLVPLTLAGVIFILNFTMAYVVNLVFSSLMSLCFKPFFELFWSALGGLESDIKNLASDLESTAKSIADKVGSVISSLGSDVSSDVSSLGSDIGSIF